MALAPPSEQVRAVTGARDECRSPLGRSGDHRRTPTGGPCLHSRTGESPIGPIDGPRICAGTARSSASHVHKITISLVCGGMRPTDCRPDIQRQRHIEMRDGKRRGVKRRMDDKLKQRIAMPHPSFATCLPGSSVEVWRGKPSRKGTSARSSHATNCSLEKDSLSNVWTRIDTWSIQFASIRARPAEPCHRRCGTNGAIGALLESVRVRTSKSAGNDRIADDHLRVGGQRTRPHGDGRAAQIPSKGVHIEGSVR
jgi:hypothetical protein